jgi:hypothetical protein
MELGTQRTPRGHAIESANSDLYYVLKFDNESIDRSPPIKGLCHVADHRTNRVQAKQSLRKQQADFG